MAEAGTEPTLRGYLHVLSRGRWWVAAGTLLGLGISLALSVTAAKQYSAVAQILVQSTANVSGSTAADQAGVTPTDVETELQLVTSAQVQQAVAKRLGSVSSVSTAEVGQTDVIALTAVSSNPAQAALIANTYANAFVAWSTATASSNLSAAEKQLNGQIGAISKQISGLHAASGAQAAALSNQQAVLKGQLAQLQVNGATASTGLEVVTPATAPSSPSSPKPVEDALLGVLAGLVVGIAAAFLRDSLDDTVSSGELAERALDVPVLATVPVVASWRRKRISAVIAVSDPTSQPAEAYRSLRTSLQFARQEERLRTLLVTSSGAGDGKTSTTVNLGAAFAQAGFRVVIVSCDLRRPGLGQFFPPGDGGELSQVLMGLELLERAVIPVSSLDGVWTLSNRGPVANPTELLSGPRMRSVIAELSRRFDIVLMDSPPVLPVADAMILARYADAAIVVVATGQTKRAELRRTRDKLAQAGVHVIGAVLNKATAQDEYGYYSSSYRPYELKQNGHPLPAGQPGQSQN
jgi:polysaccharide biosynthesis transport protein